MKKANRTVTADEIADMADRGEDESPDFSNRGNRGKKKYPTQRVNFDQQKAISYLYNSLSLFSACAADRLSRRGAGNTGLLLSSPANPAPCVRM